MPINHTRLGAAEGPANIFPNSFEKFRCQLRANRCWRDHACIAMRHDRFDDLRARCLAPPNLVGGRLVASLARPGGNPTGFLSSEFGFSGKWLELLKEIAPCRLFRAAAHYQPHRRKTYAPRHSQKLFFRFIMLPPEPFVPPPMHSLWLLRKGVKHARAASKPLTDFLRFDDVAVAECRLSCCIGEAITMPTAPRLVANDMQLFTSTLRPHSQTK